MMKHSRFTHGTPEKYVAININIGPHHFKNNVSILRFLEDVDLWTYGSNRDEHDLLLTIHKYLSQQQSIVAVSIYRDHENGLMILAYTDIVEPSPSKDWARWIRLTSKKTNFNFTLFEMAKDKSDGIQDGTIPFPKGSDFKLDQELTNKYSKLGVFF